MSETGLSLGHWCLMLHNAFDALLKLCLSLQT